MRWLTKQRSRAAQYRNLERHAQALAEKYAAEKAAHESALRELDRLRSRVAVLETEAERHVSRAEHVAALNRLEHLVTEPRTGGQP